MPPRTDAKSPTRKPQSQALSTIAARNNGALTGLSTIIQRTFVNIRAMVTKTTAREYRTQAGFVINFDLSNRIYKNALFARSNRLLAKLANYILRSATVKAFFCCLNDLHYEELCNLFKFMRSTHNAE